jgi:hypothetical protein
MRAGGLRGGRKGRFPKVTEMNLGGWGSVHDDIHTSDDISVDALNEFLPTHA